MALPPTDADSNDRADKLAPADLPTTVSPAIAGGRIYLRTFEALYAIGPTTTDASSPRDVSSNPSPRSGGN